MSYSGAACTHLCLGMKYCMGTGTIRELAGCDG